VKDDEKLRQRLACPICRLADRQKKFLMVTYVLYLYVLSLFCPLVCCPVCCLYVCDGSVSTLGERGEMLYGAPDARQ
jgi:hypothetical protein